MANGNGYPDGARATPIPDLFFSRDLPALDDPVALKVLLHAFWRITRRPRGSPPALRRPDLNGDPTLRRGVATLGVPEAELGRAIAQALTTLERRGLIVRVRVRGRAAPQTWWLLDDHLGRRTVSLLEAEERLLPLEPDEDGAEAHGEPASFDPAFRPTIFTLYEENVGLLSPLVADQLTDANASYPADWIEDAFRLAAEANVRKWAYVKAILERWAKEGRNERGGMNEDHRRAAGRDDARRDEGQWDAWIKR